MNVNQAHEILGTSADMSDEQLRKFFKKAIAKAHRDHGGSDVKMRAVLEAKDTIDNVKIQKTLPSLPSTVTELRKGCIEEALQTFAGQDIKDKMDAIKEEKSQIPEQRSLLLKILFGSAALATVGFAGHHLAEGIAYIASNTALALGCLGMGGSILKASFQKSAFDLNMELGHLERELVFMGQNAQRNQNDPSADTKTNIVPELSSVA